MAHQSLYWLVLGAILESYLSDDTPITFKTSQPPNATHAACTPSWGLCLPITHLFYSLTLLTRHNSPNSVYKSIYDRILYLKPDRKGS